MQEISDLFFLKSISGGTLMIQETRHGCFSQLELDIDCAIGVLFWSVGTGAICALLGQALTPIFAIPAGIAGLIGGAYAGYDFWQFCGKEPGCYDYKVTYYI